MKHSLLGIGIALSLVAGCSDDPVRYSEPVGINLKAKSSNTVAGVVSDEKGINTESGNPYGAFVNGAKAQLGGRDPSQITLEKLELTLGAGSVGVTRIGEVFTGAVDVLFVMNDTNNTFNAGNATIAATAGGGPEAFSATFDSSTLGSADYAKLLSGSFKVSIRGTAGAGFETKGADADLQLTFTFAAFE